ncbi:MCM2/3/5 family-domain-containing protein [Fennellomyces sp. T-0311]|nr:MCM2/3/5 family-domain-containing protein [Fennellomyces sp. T-0311]
MDVDGQQQQDAQIQARRINPFNTGAITKVVDELAESVKEAFVRFLENFRDDSASYISTGQSEYQGRTYMMQIEQLQYNETQTVYVDFTHIQNADEGLATALKQQYYRLSPYLRRAVQEVVQRHFPQYAHANTSSTESVAGAILREFAVSFYSVSDFSRVRQLKTEKIGQLITISGTVTRTTEVRPELVYGSFTCNECGKVMNDIEQQFRYTEPTMCQGLQCFNRQHWTLNVEQSKFVDWQKVRIQENSSEIPTGSMPRSMDVIVRGEMVERAKAGDKCNFVGTLIVVPDVAAFRTPGTSVESQRDTSTRTREGLGNEGVTGLKSLGVRDLTYRMSFLACMVQPANTNKSNTNLHGDDLENESREQVLNDYTHDEIEQLKGMLELNRNIYPKLVNSIAPNVFGHDTIKKGILLQLMGGVHKETPEGMSLRGDINVCIVGDPSTSKSQFLKYVCGFMPRSVYTSGKASSAAGLTAAVIKDEETGEFSIEAGALMLADNGICAIDEFDKMDIKDQVAIHEAMEQQTISIAKAGIQASLNARTSILAAANPQHGRYDRKKTLKANINMSAPIMSRFDLFFVVLDECNDVTDYNIARHIVNVHRLKDDYMQPEFSTEQLQRYIRFARTFKPKMTPEAAEQLANCYRDLRQGDAQGIGKNSYRITVRQLESMIRLSEAIARAHCQDEITEGFVLEAYNLLQKSIIRVEQDDVDIEDPINANVVSSAEALEGMNRLTLQETEDDNMQVEEPSSAQSEQRQRVRIDYDKFVQIKLMLAHKLRSLQASDDNVGIRRSELVLWYLEQREEQLLTEEHYEQEKTIIEKVIKKLAKPEHETLLEIRQDAEYDTSDSAPIDEDDETSEDDPLIMLHPNCVLLE